MPVFLRPFILLLLLPVRIFAQDSVALDLTKPEYTMPLNYTAGTIGSTLRSYGYHDLVNLSGEASQPQATPEPATDKSYSMANTVNLSREALFADALFLRQANFSNIFFNAESDFRGTRFNSPADFSEATFYELANFMGTRFDSTTIFSDAFFQLTSNFINARFNGRAFFRKADFRFPALFSGTQFGSESDFSGAHFDSIIFAGAEFRGVSAFSGTSFSTFSDFSGAHFLSSVDFTKAHFNASANFNNAQFDKDADFSDAHFKYRSCLMLSKIKVNTYTTFDFSHAVLPDSIDFSRNPNISSVVSSIVDFTQADSLYTADKYASMTMLQKIGHMLHAYFYPTDTTGTYRKHKINLYNTDISRVKIDYDHFRFYAYDAESSNNREVSQASVNSIYEGLLKNYENRGQKESFDKLDVEYKRYKAGLLPGEFSFQDMWWGFGHQKWRIFIHSFLLIILFSLVTYFMLPRMNDINYGVYHVNAVPDFSYDLKQRPFRRMWCSMVYTCNIFFAVRLKTDKLRLRRPWVASTWLILMYVTGLVCIGFMLNVLF